jgi:transposase
VAKLTVTVDEKVLKRALRRASERGTSLSAVVRAFLERYAGAEPARRRAVADLLHLARASATARGRRPWNRNALHDR